MNMLKRASIGLSGLALAGLLAACATEWDNKPEAYRAGWGDGCDSGMFDHGSKIGTFIYARDDGRYAADTAYRQSWEVGYKSCYDEAEQTYNGTY